MKWTVVLWWCAAKIWTMGSFRNVPPPPVINSVWWHVCTQRRWQWVSNVCLCFYFFNQSVVSRTHKPTCCSSLMCSCCSSRHGMWLVTLIGTSVANTKRHSQRVHICIWGCHGDIWYIPIYRAYWRCLLVWLEEEKDIHNICITSVSVNLVV